MGGGCLTGGREGAGGWRRTRPVRTAAPAVRTPAWEAAAAPRGRPVPPPPGRSGCCFACAPAHVAGFDDKQRRGQRHDAAPHDAVRVAAGGAGQQPRRGEHAAEYDRQQRGADGGAPGGPLGDCRGGRAAHQQRPDVERRRRRGRRRRDRRSPAVLRGWTASVRCRDAPGRGLDGAASCCWTPGSSCPGCACAGLCRPYSPAAGHRMKARYRLHLQRRCTGGRAARNGRSRCRSSPPVPVSSGNGRGNPPWKQVDRESSAGGGSDHWLDRLEKPTGRAAV